MAVNLARDMQNCDRVLLMYLSAAKGPTSQTTASHGTGHQLVPLIIVEHSLLWYAVKCMEIFLLHV